MNVLSRLEIEAVNIAGRGDEIASLNPATGKEIARVQLAAAADYHRMAAESVDVFRRWRMVPAPKRGQIVREIADELRAVKAELGALVSLEMGKILAEGLGEVQEMIDMADFAVGLSRQLYGVTMPSERPGHRMYEHWHPLGVAGVITAFNFPVAVWAWNALLAAVCGDCVIWKPSDETPLTAVAVDKICRRVFARHGWDGVFQVAIGTGSTVGEAMIADRRLPLISFTGSTRTGNHVAGVVANRLGRSILELGGNNAIIVMDDADLKLAIPAILFGSVGTAGQRCTSTRRLYLQRGIAAKLRQTLIGAYKQIKIGDPLDASTLMGPLVSERAVENMMSGLKTIRAQGGEVIYGGNRLHGCFVEPALVQAPAEMPIINQEIFAPILYLIEFERLDDVIELHNRVPQGLSSAIFTANLKAAETFLSHRGSDCGIANVNIGTSGAEIGGAFGGEKETGGGREAGSDSWKAYMRRQTSTINWSDELPLAQGIEFGIYSMCGIAGYTHRERAVDPAVMTRITASLIHRGPDQQGTFESRDVSLGAVRLKIIDLSGGDQPMQCGDTVIAFNGEIYNHAELRKELESLGHVFETQCDTEVVLHAFVEWDLACLKRLRGMFAIALWSESKRRLVLARDRQGIKPLYFHRRGQDVYFGSELKALFGHSEIPRRLDTTGLLYYLALNYVPCPHTLVEGIEKLPPGHLLEWVDGKIRIESYWELDFRPRARSMRDATEELDGLLKSAVREQMVADVPLGVWSSGGIDSSTILHYAAGAHLKTFSVSFAGRSFDESKYFREIARIYGTDHHEFDLNPDVELADAIGEFAYYSDEPSADAGALPVWFLSRMTRKHVTVALSGDGGDELFGGYLTYQADRWHRRLSLAPPALRRAALSAARLWPVSDDKIGIEYMVKRMLEGSLLPPDDAHFFWNGTNSPAEIAGLDLQALYKDAPGGLNRYLFVDHHCYLPDDILYKVDRMSMAHSLEVRPPLLDHRIVEFAASLPEDMKIRGGAGKVVLRELMKDKLPASILSRRKTGFDVPAHDWFRGILRPLLADTLTPAAVRASGISNYVAVESLVRAHLERRANVGYHLWGLLTLFLWMKRWGIEAGAPELSDRGVSRAALSTK